MSFRPADILFIRSGYVKALKGMSAKDAASMATTPNMPGIGVEAGEEMLRWIWEQEFSAVAGDMIAFESVPFASTTHWMHEWLLAGWGIPIGELFDLERLSAECKRIGKWIFFFSSVPLNVSLALVWYRTVLMKIRSPEELRARLMVLRSCN